MSSLFKTMLSPFLQLSRPIPSLNTGLLLFFGRTGTKFTFLSKGNPPIPVSLEKEAQKSPRTPKPEQPVQESHQIPRAQLSAMLHVGAEDKRKGPQSPSTGVTCVPSACVCRSGLGEDQKLRFFHGGGEGRGLSPPSQL